MMREFRRSSAEGEVGERLWTGAWEGLGGACLQCAEEGGSGVHCDLNVFP